MAIKFIGLERRGRTHTGVSSFSLSESDPYWLSILGELPHGFDWRPRSAADRDALVEWLRGLDFDA